MKKSVMLLAFVVVFLMGLSIDSDARMCGKGMGKGTGMAKGPGMCGQCMGMAGERPMMGARMMAMVTNLGLDEKQTTSFKAIHLKMKKERIQKNAEISVAEMELGEVLDSDPVDMKAAEAKVRQIAALRSELKMLHIRTHEAVKAMLTPEQRRKLDSITGMGMMGCGKGMDCAKGMGSSMGMMEKCRMMGDREGMMQMNRMNMSDDDLQDADDMDAADMPAEGHAH